MNKNSKVVRAEKISSAGWIGEAIGMGRGEGRSGYSFYVGNYSVRAGRVK